MIRRGSATATPPGEWLKSGDLNMHYLDWGGSGEPVVVLHGAASSCHWYDMAIPHISDSLRVIALDQRAHGKTDQPSTGYDWRTLAGDGRRVARRKVATAPLRSRLTEAVRGTGASTWRVSAITRHLR